MKRLLKPTKNYFGELPYIERQREIWPDHQNLGKRGRVEALNEKATPEPIPSSTDSSTQVFKKMNTAGGDDGAASSAELPAALEGHMRDENEETVEEETDEKEVDEDEESEVDEDENSDADQVLSFNYSFIGIH